MRYASIMLAAVCSFTRVWAESYATIYQPTYHSTYRTDSIYGDAEVFKLGSSQVVDFDTSWSAWSMYLVQYLPNSDQDLFGYTTIVEQSGDEVKAKNFNWTVQLYDLDLAASPIFYISLYKDGQNATDDDYTFSAYFNITEADASITTATGTVAAATASGSHPAQTAVLTPTTTAATDSSGTIGSGGGSIGNSNQGQSSGGLSTGAQAGIGVGVGISALAAIVCAAALFFYMRRNGRRNIESAQQQQAMTPKPTEPPVYHSGYHSGYPSTYPSGYPSPYQASEMLHDDQQQTAYQQQQQKQDQPEMRVASELYAPLPSESASPNSPQNHTATYRQV